MIRAVVFDFDMTLVDSAGAIWSTMLAVAREKNLREPSLEEVRGTIGLLLTEALDRIWGQGGSSWAHRYREIMRDNNYSGIEPFPDTVPLLKDLRDRRIAVAVASNRHDVQAAMEALGLLGFCPVAIGAANLEPKPSPAVLLEALSRLERSPSESLYVGDTDLDMEAAVNAGVGAVGVVTGNCGPQVLRRAGAVKVLSRLGELIDVLEEL